MKEIKSATVQFEVNGKIDTFAHWPLNRPSNTILTEEQLALVDTLIDELVAKTKTHFQVYGWDIWAFCDLEELHSQIFGCNWEDYVRARIAESKGVAVRYGGDGTKFVSTEEKVFYSTKRNCLYIAHQLKDIDNDVFVGPL